MKAKTDTNNEDSQYDICICITKYLIKSELPLTIEIRASEIFSFVIPEHTIRKFYFIKVSVISYYLT